MRRSSWIIIILSSFGVFVGGFICCLAILEYLLPSVVSDNLYQLSVCETIDVPKLDGDLLDKLVRAQVLPQFTPLAAEEFHLTIDWDTNGHCGSFRLSPEQLIVFASDLVKDGYKKVEERPVFEPLTLSVRHRCDKIDAGTMPSTEFYVKSTNGTNDKFLMNTRSGLTYFRD